MTDKEIKELASQYVKATIDPEYKSPDLALEIRAREREIASFIKFLSSRFCIVSREKVKECFQNIMDNGRYVCEFEDKLIFDYDVECGFCDLFGEEIFTDKTEKQ